MAPGPGMNSVEPTALALGRRVLAFLIAAPASYTPETGWRPGPALLAGALILACAPVAALAAVWVYAWLAGLKLPGATAPGVLARHQAVQTAIYFAVMHSTFIVSTLAAARQFESRPLRALALEPPAAGVPAYLAAILAGAAGAALWFGALLAFAPELVLADLRPNQGRLQAEFGWLLLPVLCLLAPLSEELLFRGFLFSALSKSSLGRAGAALVTTSLWTALHVGHTPIAQAQVFASGLLLSWLLVRTGSLRVPIACHVLFNSALGLVLLLTPPLG